MLVVLVVAASVVLYGVGGSPKVGDPQVVFVFRVQEPIAVDGVSVIPNLIGLLTGVRLIVIAA